MGVSGSFTPWEWDPYANWMGDFLGPRTIRTRCRRETICAGPLTSRAPCSSSWQLIYIDRTAGFPSKLPYSTLWTRSPRFESTDFSSSTSFSPFSHYTGSTQLYQFIPSASLDLSNRKRRQIKYFSKVTSCQLVNSYQPVQEEKSSDISWAASLWRCRHCFLSFDMSVTSYQPIRQNIP
jgi:hypothetical protein